MYSDYILFSLLDFLHIVTKNQGGSRPLFAGTHIDECVEEIILYCVRGHEKKYESIYNLIKLLLVPQGVNKEKVCFKLSDDRFPYSSLHVVCNALSHQGGRDKKIPVEVQIRTVFEDAWAEIDHPLHYKSNIDYGNDREDDLEKHLKSLKDKLDDCVKHADKIFKDYAIDHDIDHNILGQEQNSLSLFKVKENFIISEEARDGVIIIDHNLRKIDEIIRSCVPIANKILKVRDLFNDIKEKELKDTGWEVRYFLLSSEAAAYLILGKISRNKFLANSLFLRSLMLFSEAEKIDTGDKFKAYSMFRMAVCSYHTGKYVQAFNYINKAVDLLVEGEKVGISDSSKLNTIIPRVAGYYSWLMFYENCFPSHIEYLDLAIEYTNQALLSAKNSNHEDALDVIYVNLISYLWEQYLQKGGISIIPNFDIDEAIQRIEGAYMPHKEKSSVRGISILDSLLQACAIKFIMMRCHEIELRKFGTLCDELENYMSGIKERLTKCDYRYMLRTLNQCRKILEGCETGMRL